MSSTGLTSATASSGAASAPTRKYPPIIYAVEPFGGSVRDHNPNLPLVFCDDAAVTRGDGVFETLLLRDGRVCNVERHVERFLASADLLDLPLINIDGWLKATTMALDKWQAITDEDATCTWVYTRGREATGIPSAWLTVKQIPATTVQQRTTGVAVMTSPRGYHIDPQPTSGAAATSATAPWLVVGAKTLSYAANMAALRWARAHDFDDVIYVNGDTVLEGATSTVITVRGKKLRTPIAGGDVLPGTTQAALFEHATTQGWRCKQKHLLVDDLYRADSVWLVSSVRIAARVTRINDQELPAPDNEAEIWELIAAALG